MYRLTFDKNIYEQVKSQFQHLKGVSWNGPTALFEEGTIAAHNNDGRILTLITAPQSPSHVLQFPWGTTGVLMLDHESATRR